MLSSTTATAHSLHVLSACAGMQSLTGLLRDGEGLGMGYWLFYYGINAQSVIQQLVLVVSVVKITFPLILLLIKNDFILLAQI